MKKKVKKKKNIQDKEEFCEVFEVKDKKGKEKIIRTCGNISKKHSTKKEKQEYNKIIRNFLIGILIIVFFIIGIILSVNHFQKISYEGIEFQKIKQGKLDLFYSRFPIRENVYFNLYLRNNPKELISLVDFNGNLTSKRIIVINSEKPFFCNGYGMISIGNLKQFYNALGAKIIKDENASCDELGRYSYINLKEGNKTRIEQYGPSCYNIYIKDCEILKGTERFILEGIKELKQSKPYLFE